MKKLLNKLAPALTSLVLAAPAWAVEDAPIPVEPSVNVLWVLVFFLVCVGGIVWYVYATNKASKQQAAEQQK